MATFAAHEDCERVSLEMEETRVRRILRQWMIGKLLFAEATLRLEKDEAQKRDAIVKEMHQSAHSMAAHAHRLHPQAAEEVHRSSMDHDEITDRMNIFVEKEAAFAMLHSRDIVRQNVHGIAYSLALWCLEGVIPEADMTRIEDKSRKNSIAVLERFSVFGKRRGPS
jgi:Rps23 Pro-64 3,4-dihydroxylase Tpa1-like proline 4-hydroxylase